MHKKHASRASQFEKSPRRALRKASKQNRGSGSANSAEARLLYAMADGLEIETVEGLTGPNGELSALQQAFVDHTAFQCSYCTPGFILTTKALLEEQPHPSREEAKEFLAGNLCRCGSYVKILDAVMDAAGEGKDGARRVTAALRDKGFLANAAQPAAEPWAPLRPSHTICEAASGSNATAASPASCPATAGYSPPESAPDPSRSNPSPP